jgi:hypothetical protein
MMHGWLRISAMLSLVSTFAEARAERLGANVVALASDHQPLGSPRVGRDIGARTRGGDSSGCATPPDWPVVARPVTSVPPIRQAQVVIRSRLVAVSGSRRANSTSHDSAADRDQ